MLEGMKARCTAPPVLTTWKRFIGSSTRCAALLVFLVWLLAVRAECQVSAAGLTGQITDSASRRPITGAVILGLEVGGRAVSRTVTDERGAYRLTLRGTERSIRVVRIGFRPVTRLTIPVDGKLDVAMTAIPTLLEPVTSTARGHCPRSWSTPAALGLFEQVRGALLNSVVAREANPAKFVRLGFRRNYGNVSSADSAKPMKDSIHRQWVQVDSADRAITPYAADIAAAGFVGSGFVGLRGTDTAFYAPDAETLLDPDFSSAYCFRIGRSDSRTPRAVIRLEFRRPQRTRGQIDIEAVLWIDTVARALERLEYRYVGLPPVASSVKPGGVLDFVELPNGMVMIARWSIKLGSPHENPIPNAPMMLEVQESGGEVASAHLPDGRVFRARLGRVELEVKSRPGVPPRPLTVGFDRTDYTALSNGWDSVSIDRLLPGPYVVVTRDTALDRGEITIPAGFAFIAMRDSVVKGKILGRNAREFVYDRCNADGIWSGLSRADSSTAWVIGRLRGSDDKSVRDAVVRISTADGRSAASARTSADGIYQVCSNAFRVGDAARVSIEHRRLSVPPLDVRLHAAITVLDPLILRSR